MKDERLKLSRLEYHLEEHHLHNDINIEFTNGNKFTHGTTVEGQSNLIQLHIPGKTVSFVSVSTYTKVTFSFVWPNCTRTIEALSLGS